MNDKKIKEYRKAIEKSNIIFLPFSGNEDLMEASSDRKINNKHEMSRKYPAYTYITKDFTLDNTIGYALVSKHYLRENIPGLFKAKTSELLEVAENMIGILIIEMNKIYNGLLK